MTLEQIKKFCSLNDSREFLRRPFREGDYIVASNGHIAVRVAISEALSAIEPCAVEKAKVCFGDVIDKAFRHDMEFHPIPVLPPAKQCRQCRGTGKAYKCESCEGNGEFDHDGYDYECKPCGGSGQVKDATGPDDELAVCNCCGGTGASREWQPVRIGEGYFEAFHLRIIATLTGAKVAPNGPGEIAYFTADGCDGVIMPTRV